MKTYLVLTKVIFVSPVYSGHETNRNKRIPQLRTWAKFLQIDQFATV